MIVWEELIKHYSQKSKHSNYQILPKVLEPILGEKQIEVRTRHERERLDYILKNVCVSDKTVLDIGGNTGFFSFELLDKGAKNVDLYEGNKDHCDFVELAAEVVGANNLNVTNEYYTFHGTISDSYDVALLLNVLHHVGYDYGNQNTNKEEAKHKIIEQLNSMYTVTDTLVFQLGFNWHGNPKTGLFEHGTKREMIDFIKTGTAECWNINAIGIAEKNDDKVSYNDLDEDNIERDDTLGEFLNRPIFILGRRR